MRRFKDLLVLKHQYLHAEGFASLVHLRSLQFGIGGEEYNDNLEITRLTKLTSLGLLGQGDLEPILESMKELRTLSFDIEDPIWELPVSGLSKLQSLRVNLCGGFHDLTIMLPTGTCATLRHLYLMNIHRQDQYRLRHHVLTVEVLGWLRSLTSLYLEDTGCHSFHPVTRKLPASIDLLTNLKVLRLLFGDFCFLHLDKGDVGTLKRLDSLTHLEITALSDFPFREETKNAISVLRLEMPHLDLKISGS